MITARITNGWLQIVAQSDNATDQIESFQNRVSESELQDFISCVEETLRRIDWVHENYHTAQEAQEIYNHADMVREGSFVTISYMSINRVHLIFRSASMYLSIDDLEPLQSTLNPLLDS
jgi:capsular polysaccharide biosynthesis protein